MAYADQDLRKERGTAALLSGLSVGILALLVSLGQGRAMPVKDQETMTAVNLDPIPPPAQVAPEPKKATPEPEGAAAPPNLTATPSPVVRPKPEVDVKQKTETRASPDPGQGSDNNAGAAPNPGPGSGAGGFGDGRGSGRFGSGTGGGGGIRPPVKIAGAISNRDYPKSLRKARIGGTVIVWYTIGTDGRVSNCRITQSSGVPELDQLTCRLATERFRYRPATGPDGRPVADKTGWKQKWWVEGRNATDPDADPN